jgi:hypothetical protein
MPDPYLELEEKLRPLADPLPAPRLGDWLAEHDEPGQTFAEYLEARPVRKRHPLPYPRRHKRFGKKAGGSCGLLRTGLVD